MITVTCAATTDELTKRLQDFTIVDGSLTVRCDSVDNSLAESCSLQRSRQHSLRARRRGKMDLAQMKAAVTMEGVLFGTAALELIAEVERLGGIVTALEEGCHKCQHPVRVRELTCQKKALQQVVAERDAEISRLTALCDGYRGEVDALLKEAESTLAFYAEKGRVTVSRDGNAVQRMGASAEIAILKAESALTRARAEGMKEAIKSADDVPATVSVYPTFEQARGAASAKEQIIAAIRERATKGDSDEG